MREVEENKKISDPAKSGGASNVMWHGSYETTAAEK